MPTSQPPERGPMPPLQNARGQTTDNSWLTLPDGLPGAGWVICGILLGAMSAGFMIGVGFCLTVMRVVPHG